MVVSVSATIRMGSNALLRGTILGSSSNVLLTLQKWSVRSVSVRFGLQPPDLPRLAETALISLTPDEVEAFAPKIQQVVDWFGQLQNVDLQSLRPAIRADSEGEKFRDDVPEIFENREAIISALPNYEEPFIKVPKVLNTE